MVLLAMPATAIAQDTAEKRWGVNVSFTPSWKANTTLQSKLQWAPSEEDWPAHEGSEFTVGFVRGSVAGGELGVSLVRKRLDDSTATIVSEGDACFGAVCIHFEDREATETRDVYVQGVEVHFFIPFVTWANRFQVGLNVGGGVGFPSGTVIETSTQTITQPGLPPVVSTQTTVEEGDATGVAIGSIVPLIKAEAQVAILVAPGLKLNVAVGMNAPSIASFRIGVTYLFGAR